MNKKPVNVSFHEQKGLANSKIARVLWAPYSVNYTDHNIMVNHLINLLICQTIKNNVKVSMVGYFWQFLRQLLFWLRHSEQWNWHE